MRCQPIRPMVTTFRNMIPQEPKPEKILVFKDKPEEKDTFKKTPETSDK